MLRRARVHAPSAITALQSARGARADAAGAGRWPRSNPVIRIGGDYELDVDPSRTFGVGVQQEFDIAGVAIARNRQAGASVRVASLTAQTALLDALRETADAFIDVDLATRSLVIWRQLAQMYEEIAAASARTEAAGVTAHQQTLLATIELASIAGDLNQVSSDLARSRAALAVLVNAPSANELSVASADDLPAPDGRGIDALLTLALAHRPELPALRAQLQEANARGTAAALALVPSPTIAFGLRSDRFVIDQREVRPNSAGLVGIGGADHRSTMVYADLSFPIPLFDRNQAERARAGADALTARENLAIAERRVRAEVAAAIGTRDATWATYERWRGINAALNEAQSLARQGYDAGQIGIVDTLVALERVVRGRLAFVRSRAAYWRERVVLARALGDVT